MSDAPSSGRGSVLESQDADWLRRLIGAEPMPQDVRAAPLSRSSPAELWNSTTAGARPPRRQQRVTSVDHEVNDGDQ
jgi:hypothetical protein